MELFEAVKSRGSIRSYTEEEVTDEEVNRILEATTWAPRNKHSLYNSPINGTADVLPRITTCSFGLTFTLY